MGEGYRTANWGTMEVNDQFIGPVGECLNHLHLLTDLMLEVPLTRRARYGDLAFSVAAPIIWNSLPGCVKSCSTLGELKSELKKHLFSCIYSVDLPNA